MLTIIIATICVLGWLYMATQEPITQEQYDYIKNELKELEAYTEDVEAALEDCANEYLELDEEFNRIELENCSLCHEIDCLRGDM